MSLAVPLGKIFFVPAILLILAIGARGADLKVTKADAYQSSDGKKTVELSVGVAPGVKIDRSRLSLVINLYAKTATGVAPALNLPTSTSWLIPRAWTPESPATLQVDWPAVDRKSGGAPVGVVVGIYYRGELQTSWSFPAQLAKDFPLPPQDAP